LPLEGPKSGAVPSVVTVPGGVEKRSIVPSRSS